MKTICEHIGDANEMIAATTEPLSVPAIPPWVFSSYPSTIAKRAAITWKPEGDLCECGRYLHVGRLDGRQVAATCFRCGVREWHVETLD